MLVKTLEFQELLLGMKDVFNYLLEWQGVISMQMIVRDSYSELNNDKKTYEFQSGEVEIVAEDGRALFSIIPKNDSSVYISSGPFCKHGGTIFDKSLKIMPVATNAIIISREEYIEK